MELFGINLAEVSYTVYVGVIVVLLVAVCYLVYALYFGDSSAGESAPAQKKKSAPKSDEIDDVIDEINAKQAKTQFKK